MENSDNTNEWGSGNEGGGGTGSVTTVVGGGMEGAVRKPHK